MASGKKKGNKKGNINTKSKYQTIISSFDDAYFVSILSESTSLPCQKKKKNYMLKCSALSVCYG
jgi:hypothetical protein